jgi:lipid-A-disaccharide synthase
MAAIRRRAGAPVSFAGVGGERMSAEGLDPLFPVGDLAVMGIVEVVPALPRLLRRWRQITAAARAFNPSVVVTIDSSGFSKGVAKRLRRAGVTAPRVHYVAPMIWAWRPGRARGMARLFDHLLTLFPFEAEPFRAAGLEATWVGHPAAEAPSGDGTGFRTRHGIAPAAPVLCVLPGSRRAELAQLLPVFGPALARITAACPDVRVVLPTLPAISEVVRQAAGTWPAEAVVVDKASDRRDAIAASNAALAASGSVTLELALAGVPMAIAYRVAAPTAAILRRVLRVPHVGLPNILLGEAVIPELLQERCTPHALAAVAIGLLSNDGEANRQRQAFARLRSLLVPPGDLAPSERAAEAVLALATARKRAQIDGNRAAGGPSR